MPSSRPSPRGCAVCLRQITVTNAGVIHLHGPVGARCPGSGQPTGQPPGTVLSQLAQASPVGGAAVTSHRAVPTASLPPRPSAKVLKRVPKASRELCGRKLADLLNAVVRKNDHDAWVRLLGFSARCLSAPPRGGKWRSLASFVNGKLREEADAPAIPSAATTAAPRPRRGKSAHLQDPFIHLAARVSSKLEEGDFSGAVRLACSDDALAEPNEATYSALQQKHPSPYPGSSIPPRPSCHVP